MNDRARFSIFFAVLLFPIACRPVNVPEQPLVAWHCMAQQDVMALSLGSSTGPVEIISFDGGGMAIHLNGLPPYAPDYDEVKLTLVGQDRLRIHFITMDENIEIHEVDDRCLHWLSRNRLVE